MKKKVVKPNRVIKIGVAAFVQNNQYEYLLTKKRKIARGAAWSLPGGLVRFGEDPDDAVERIVMKETGIRVHSVGLASTVPFSGVQYKDAWHIILFFIATAWAGDKIREAKYEIGWFKAKEFPSELLYPLPDVVSQLMVTSSLP